MLGRFDGSNDGAPDGSLDGMIEGSLDRYLDGLPDGAELGIADGVILIILGVNDGNEVASDDDSILGIDDGVRDGL